MPDWTPQIAGSSRPRYAAIVQALAGDIEGGLLSSGDRLPTQRSLADKLGISLGTVTRAYTEARRQGLIEGEVGRGTFVRDREREDTRWALDAALDRSVIDLSLLFAPSIEGTPAAAPLREGLADLARRIDLDHALGYQPHAGAPSHREAGAVWIARTGLETHSSDVVVTAGGQHALTCALSVVARPGDVVMTEALTAPGFKDIASWMPLRPHGLPGDEFGLLPMAFEAACRLGVSRVLYTMPVLQNPTTITMSLERRKEIAAIANRYGVAVIEDGVLGLLPGDGITPLSAFAPDSSYYVTSLSKTLVPGLRLGFIRAPGVAVSRLEDAIRATMWMASPLLAEAAAGWIADGTAATVLEARRSEARHRQRMAADALEGYSFAADSGGYHLWLDPGPGWQADDFVRAARAAGVAITPAEVFVAGRGHVPSRVRLGLTSAADRPELARGLEILRAVLDAGRRPNGG
jgi:DNA-binding transcriptional MocR family regulator